MQLHRGTEKLWLLGLNFVENTAGRALAPRNDTYINTAFEAQIFSHSFHHMFQATGNAISKLVNALIFAINNQKRIPKWILIVPEGDLLHCTAHTQFGVSSVYGLIIEYIMSSMDTAIHSLIDKIPHRANKYNWPYFLWVEPTLHMKYTDNSLRGKFIKSLHTAALMHDRTVVLPLKQMWCENSPNIYDSNLNKLTPAGLNTIWRAIDQAVRYADTKIMRNFGLPLKRIFQKNKIQKETEQKIANFESRAAARREMTRQLQQNQVARFFNRASGHTMNNRAESSLFNSTLRRADVQPRSQQRFRGGRTGRALVLKDTYHAKRDFSTTKTK